MNRLYTLYYILFLFISSSFSFYSPFYSLSLSILFCILIYILGFTGPLRPLLDLRPLTASKGRKGNPRANRKSRIGRFRA